MERAFKFKLYPKNSQVETMERWLYLFHDLYNAGLQQRIMAHKDRSITISSYRQNRELPELKKGLKEYREIHSQVLQNVFDRLDKAYENFFMRVKRGEKPGFPRFKSLKRYNSFTYPQSGFRILDNGHLYLSGIGEVRVFKHREMEGTIKTCIIKKDRVGDWFASFSVELPDPVPRELKTAVGIDLGLEKMATLSTEEFVNNPRFLKSSESVKKHIQKILSGKKKGSNNRRKARVKLAKEERNIARQMDDYIHKVSRTLSTKADAIIFENLNINNMVKNHHLSKSILDASWGKLIQYTTYKAEEAGGEVVLVDPRNTSQICSKCGGYVQKSLSERIHICQDCGFVADRTGMHPSTY